MYAGIVVLKPGIGLSTTTFLDAVALAFRAFEHDRGRAPRDLAEVARWQGANVAAAQERRQGHGSRYISILGLFHPAGDPLTEGLSLSIAEKRLGDRSDMDTDGLGCTCGRCPGETEAVFCGQVATAFGIGWQELRAEHEHVVGSDQGDLLLWDNVTMLHGAICGSAERMLRSIYLSIADPVGFKYERWLSERWRIRAGSLPRPTRARKGSPESVDAVSAPRVA